MSENIFIVDDNILNLELMTDILKSEEFITIKTFDNPTDVLTSVYEGQRPTLVITDYKMMLMDGVTLLCTLSAILWDLSGIIVSSDVFAVYKRSEDFPVIDKTNFDFGELLLDAVRSSLDHQEVRRV